MIYIQRWPFASKLLFKLSPLQSHWLAIWPCGNLLKVHMETKALNPICHGLLGPDSGGGSNCPDSIQPTILMIFSNSVFTGAKIRIYSTNQNMRPLAFNLLPWEIFENSGIFSKIVKNLNFAIWKNVFLNFVGPPRWIQDRESALAFFYWTTMDKL